jgi:hypothetical protein
VRLYFALVLGFWSDREAVKREALSIFNASVEGAGDRRATGLNDPRLIDTVMMIICDNLDIHPVRQCSFTDTVLHHEVGHEDAYWRRVMSERYAVSPNDAVVAALVELQLACAGTPLPQHDLPQPLPALVSVIAHARQQQTTDNAIQQYIKCSLDIGQVLLVSDSVISK